MTMTAALPYRTDIQLHRSASFSRKIVWKKKSDGTPAINFADFNAKMTIKPVHPNKGPVITLTNANGGLVIDADEGSVTIVLTTEQTATMRQVVSANKYADFDLLLHPKVGTEPVYALIRGEIDVYNAVTTL